MNIVYALTRNVYHKIIPSLKSLMEFNPKASVYIVAEDDEIPDLPCKAKVINVTNQEWFPTNGVNYHNQFTYINFLKVVYPTLLPKLQKVIHLDIDTVICEDLTPLWQTDIKNKWVAACPEYRGSYKPFGDTYYNMGVALINLAQMRKDNIEPLMVEYLNTVPQKWADQDAWNKYGIEQDKFTTISTRYNENIMTATSGNPAIVHYCSIKNWYEDPHVDRRGYLNKYLNGNG